jgi:general secretion pathway protein A
LTREEFIRTLASRFDLGIDAATSKAVLLEGLEKVVRERRAQGQVTALVVDEAQALSNELLEEVRLLANIETEDEKLLPLVLAGQPELSVRLEEVGLRQLKQRVALRCEVAPFELSETAAYIATRIRTAGGVPSKLFTREGVLLIHEHSAGIPRTINVICDNALVSGMALGRQLVERSIVLEVCRDFCLRPKPGNESMARGFEETEDLDGPRTIPDAPMQTSDDSSGRIEAFDNVPKPRRFTLFGSR